MLLAGRSTSGSGRKRRKRTVNAPGLGEAALTAPPELMAALEVMSQRSRRRVLAVLGSRGGAGNATATATVASLTDSGGAEGGQGMEGAGLEASEELAPWLAATPVALGLLTDTVKGEYHFTKTIQSALRRLVNVATQEATAVRAW